MTLARAVAPCGACAAYVDAAAGCKHWVPPVRREVQRERARRWEAAARERARRDVAEFRRVMAAGRT